jgi:hypothetical protein
MKKALRKVARGVKTPKLEVSYVDETGPYETESEIEQDNVEEEKGSQPWQTIVREKR